MNSNRFKVVTIAGTYFYPTFDEAEEAASSKACLTGEDTLLVDLYLKEKNTIPYCWEYLWRTGGKVR